MVLQFYIHFLCSELPIVLTFKFFQMFTVLHVSKLVTNLKAVLYLNSVIFLSNTLKTAVTLFQKVSAKIYFHPMLHYIYIPYIYKLWESVITVQLAIVIRLACPCHQVRRNSLLKSSDYFWGLLKH